MKSMGLICLFLVGHRHNEGGISSKEKVKMYASEGMFSADRKGKDSFNPLGHGVVGGF